ncbi:hypothetical protein Maq22A_2p41820 (plasmid) [Methylobacterium aquaticum]|uniref:Uncharacterized protein n=1 Tax=Methylobacterium aquaticum TaxID=270351 RepID=A0A0C6FWZ6_9HYPH|nr:hypothetical protein Maq22A_2p41820 [Methylobacterium aquaticum]
MNSARIWLKSIGSSRFRVWPVFGRTARPEVDSVRLKKRPGCRQWSSSSPTTTKRGAAIARSSSTMS